MLVLAVSPALEKLPELGIKKGVLDAGGARLKGRRSGAPAVRRLSGL